MPSLRDRIRAAVLRWLGVNEWALLDSDAMHRRLGQEMLYRHRVFGDPARLTVGEGVVLNDALVNTTSGRVTLADHAFCGHGVSLLTGTHDYRRTGYDRHAAVPQEGRDIVVGRGAWIGSNATVLGPCRIGDDAVIAAGAVVTGDVREGWIYAGIPARPVKPALEQR